MTTRSDPLMAAQPAERVYYATGILLDADDFQDEQSYHRGRLMRALANLHGYGTVSGLKVSYQQTPAAALRAPLGGASPLARPVEQIIVEPGLAVDRLGRLIEVPGQLCLRLDRWWESMAQSTDPAEVGALVQAYNPLPAGGVRQIADPPYAATLNAADFGGGGALPSGVVVIDLFLRFVVCEAGKTPAFASGPFDALDAVQPSRLRDTGELLLVPRPEKSAKAAPNDGLSDVVPVNPWAQAAALADPTQRRAALFERILDPTPLPVSEYARGQADPTAVLLARLAIQAQPPAGKKAPARPDPIPAAAVYINNYLRPFLVPTRALSALLSL